MTGETCSLMKGRPYRDRRGFVRSAFATLVGGLGDQARGRGDGCRGGGVRPMRRSGRASPCACT